MTPLAFILCFACAPIPASPGDTEPPPGSTSLPPGEEMLEPAWMFGGHDLRTGPLIEKGDGWTQTTSLRPNWGLKTVGESDHDDDGVMDSRYTTEELSETKKRRMLEKKETPDGPWIVEYDEVGYAGDIAAPPSSGIDYGCLDEIGQRFPQDIGAPRYGNAAVAIPYGRPLNFRCTPEQGLEMQAAFECVVKKTETCLSDLNPEMAGRMRTLLSATETKVVVSCTGECNAGQTKYMRRGTGFIEAIELPLGYSAYGKKGVCEFLFHELLHAAGIPKGKEHDAKGNDALYSCARVCSGCSHATRGAGNDHIDCAVCGDPKDKKAKCGLMPKVQDTYSEPPYDMCLSTAPMTYVSAPCKGHKIDGFFCDKTPSGQYLGSLTYCCEKCPDGYAYPGGGNEDRCTPFRGFENARGSTCDQATPLSLCDA